MLVLGFRMPGDLFFRESIGEYLHEKRAVAEHPLLRAQTQALDFAEGLPGLGPVDTAGERESAPTFVQLCEKAFNVGSSRQHQFPFLRVREPAGTIEPGN